LSWQSLGSSLFVFLLIGVLSNPNFDHYSKFYLTPHIQQTIVDNSLLSQGLIALTGPLGPAFQKLKGANELTCQADTIGETQVNWLGIASLYTTTVPTCGKTWGLDGKQIRAITAFGNVWMLEELPPGKISTTSLYETTAKNREQTDG